MDDYLYECDKEKELIQAEYNLKEIIKCSSDGLK